MRNRYILLADLVAIVLCAVGAFVLRLDWFFTRLPEYTAAFRFFLVAALVVKPTILYAFGLYPRSPPWCRSVSSSTCCRSSHGRSWPSTGC
jgi:hypothetical protein